MEKIEQTIEGGQSNDSEPPERNNPFVRRNFYMGIGNLSYPGLYRKTETIGEFHSLFGRNSRDDNSLRFNFSAKCGWNDFLCGRWFYRFLACK